ncbi:MAG TPA: Pvc16 family protein [Gemmataceae bacterium]|nr:Pvc16 family protein [Gemmataceae bacterium]
MLDLLDQIIRTVLDTGWTTAPPPAKPSFWFAVPDDDWKKQVTGTGVRLNIYLYEVRENRDLRLVQWSRAERTDQTAVLAAPPAQFDCHYLISAWSPAQETESTSPELDEHQVLSEALRVILNNPDVNAAALGVTGGGPIFQEAHVKLTVAPPEAPRVLNDFWSTMKLPWRPAVQLVATAPLDLRQTAPAGPLVTTVIRLLGPADDPGGPRDESIQIGGWVLRAADGSPLPGASVVRTDTGEQALTDALGRYTFAGLRRGPVPLRASAVGLTPLLRTLNVPAGSLEDQIFRLS